MNSRERLQAILNHKEADRVPLDLGVGMCCKFHLGTYKKLLKHFGIQDDIRICNKITQCVFVCDELLDKLETDVRVPFPLLKSKPMEEWQDESGDYLRNPWGAVYRKRKNDLYYDLAEVPLAGKFDEETVNYDFPIPDDPVAPESIEQAKAYHAAGYPLIWPDSFGDAFLQQGPKVFGYEDWMMMIATEDKKAIDFMEKLLEAKMQFLDKIADAFGPDLFDVICEADDLGTQNGPWISMEAFRRVIKPYHKKLYEYIHKKFNAKVFLHSCGSIAPFIPDLIEIGLDILNPVQINAYNMDPAFLKCEFGKDITFWGGGVDTQKILPMGSSREIRDQVKRNIEIFSKDGGFVFSAVHNIQTDVPLENFLAMWETFKEFRNY
jgi:uroporphyrinogen decarboxylase